MSRTRLPLPPPFSSTLKDIVRRHEGRLTPADQRLISLLLSNPVEAALGSAEKIASQAGVHAASLVRLAQKLGFSGFSELKSILRAEVLPPAPPNERLRRRIEGAAPEDVLASVIDRERSMLEDLSRHVSRDQIVQAASVLAEAHHIVLCAEGTGGLLSGLLEHRLRRQGRLVSRIPLEKRDIAEVFCSLTPKDAVLAFAFNTVPTVLPFVLESAALLQCPSLVISDVVGPLIRPSPDILLAAPRGLTDESQSLTVPMAICTALLLTIPLVDGGQSLTAVERYGRYRDGLAPSPSDTSDHNEAL